MARKTRGGAEGKKRPAAAAEANGDLGQLGTNAGAVQAPAARSPLVQLALRLLPRSSGGIAWLVALCVARTLLNDRLARLQGLLFKATFTKNKPYFARLLLEDVVGQVLMSAVVATVSNATARLALRWRAQLNAEIESKYFANMAYYTVANVDDRIESPEQVIANDTRVVATELSEMAAAATGALVDGSYFTHRVAQATSLRWALVPVAYVAAAVAFMQTTSPNFARLYAVKQAAEEALRYAFGHVRADAEAIAAYSGDARERALVGARMDNATVATRELNRTQGWWGIVESFVAKYCVTTVATIVILLPFFRRSTGATDNLLQNAAMLSRMRYLTSITVLQLSGCAGVAHFVQRLKKVRSNAKRVHSMLSVLTEINDAAIDRRGTTIVPGDEIAFDSVTVQTPAGVVLTTNLSFTVSRGTNLLVTGPNGAGKSSIFRVMGSLWPAKQGVVTKPMDDGGKGLCGDVFYLPQKPYCVVGDLKQQIVYPQQDAAKASLSDNRLAELLRLVDLGYLLSRADTPGVNWEKELSLGETQRLAMARLFFHKPRFAILDECTSAVSTQMETLLYRTCAELDITCVTISHRPALESFHHQKLELDGRGGYSIGELDEPDHLPSPTISSGPAAAEFFRAASPADRVHEFPPLRVAVPPPPASTAGIFWRLAALLRAASSKGLLGAKLFAVLGLVGFRVWLSDRMAHITGNNLRALLDRDLPYFARLQLQSLAQSAVQAVVAPGLVYVSRSLAVEWRDALAKHLHGRFFAGKAFYKSSSLHHLVEDADQRLTEDLDRLSTEMAAIFPDIVKPLADIAWFTAQSWLILGLKSTAALYLYMAAGFATLQLASPAFGALVEQSQALAGAFRYVHTRLRTHAEAIAFFGGDAIEGAACSEAFATLMRHEREVANANWRYGALNDFVIERFPAIVSWAMGFAFTMRVGDVVTDRGGQLSHDLRYVSALVSHLFASFGGVLELQKRVLELSGFAMRVIDVDAALTAMEAAELELERGGRGGSGASAGAGVVTADHIAFDRCDIVTPSGACLVSGLTCDVPRGESLLISGPTASGKSALARTLGGLWPVRRGTLRRPPLRDVFYVPQRPYCAIGTLADQITYPQAADIGDPAVVARLGCLLRSVRLEHLVEREGGWGVVKRWSNVLSLGEQQRLGMARLFFHSPRCAILDQCTDAVSTDVEEALYVSARENGVDSIITISQRPALSGHHDKHLQLDGAGAWALKISRGSPLAARRSAGPPRA